MLPNGASTEDLRRKTSLLSQLKLDRASPPTEKQASKAPRVALGVGAIAILLFSSYYYLRSTSRVEVAVAVVREVRSGGLQVGDGEPSVEATGYVVARRQATVSAKVTGKLKEVYLTEGQRVKAGEVLASLDDSNSQALMSQAAAEVDQANAKVAVAKVAYENAIPAHERSSQLKLTGWISQSAYEISKSKFDASKAELEVALKTLAVAKASHNVAKRTYDDMLIKAPFDGVITAKAAQPGEIVSPTSAGGGFTRTGIGTIVDMESLEVEVDVSEAFVSRIQAGQNAVIQLNAYSDWEIPAEVGTVIPTADRTKATVKVRVAFKEIDERVLPEMAARVRFLNKSDRIIETGQLQYSLLVPREAVSASGDSGTVYVIKDNVLHQRLVKLGPSTIEGQIVTSGISKGDVLAISDSENLTDGLAVKLKK